MGSQIGTAVRGQGRGARAAKALFDALALTRQRNPVIFWGGAAGFGGLAVELLVHLISRLL